MLQSNDLEQRILDLERKLLRFPEGLERRATALEQGIGQLWSGLSLAPPTPPATCDAIIRGKVRGCTAATPGVTVTVKRRSTGATLGTGTTNSSGFYNIAVTLPDVYGTEVDVVLARSRYATRTVGATATCGDNNLGTLTLSADTGYACAVDCADPIATTLHLTDSAWGAVTLTWNGASAWVGSVNVDYPGCPATGCVARTAFPLTYTLSNAAGFPCSVSYPGNGSTFPLVPCPTPATTPVAYTFDQTSEACSPLALAYAGAGASSIERYLYCEGSGGSASTAATLPGTGADDASHGGGTWSNPSRITAADSSFASVSLSGAGTQVSHYLKATNFGFALPAGAVVTGIKVEFYGDSINNEIEQETVKLVVGGAVVGNNKATPGLDIIALHTFDFTVAQWGVTPTMAEVNASNFGCVIAVADFGLADTGSVDYVKMTITYTTTVSPPTISVTE